MVESAKAKRAAPKCLLSVIPPPNRKKVKTQTLVKGQIDTNLLQGIIFGLSSLLKTVWPGVASFRSAASPCSLHLLNDQTQKASPCWLGMQDRSLFPKQEPLRLSKSSGSASCRKEERSSDLQPGSQPLLLPFVLPTMLGSPAWS